MKQKYFLQSLAFVEESPDCSTMGKAVISVVDHYECIVVYGTAYTLTERVTKIIEGLNNES